MGKKNKKGGGQRNRQEHTPDVVRQWDEYFGRGDLSDWQRLCEDLGLDGSLSSKTKCRKALKGVNVNIKDFLETDRRPEDVRFFLSKRALAEYTLSNRKKIFPKRNIEKGSPLAALMTQIF